MNFLLPAVSLAMLFALLLPARPALAADPVIGDVLRLLKERGLVDEAGYTELVARSERYERKQKSLLGRIEFSGDFRVRYENFFYDEDALGNERADRNRMRYRFRFGAKARINDIATVGFRLATGKDNIRGTNRTFGTGASDDYPYFDPDPITVDRAFIELRSPGEFPGKLVFGKMQNPFLWKHGKDYMLWDSDISLEGVAFEWKRDLSETLHAFANLGYMIIDEESSGSDPHFFAAQGGIETELANGLKLGGRATWYSFGSVSGRAGQRFAYDEVFSAGNLALGTSSFDTIDYERNADRSAFVRCPQSGMYEERNCEVGELIPDNDETLTPGGFDVIELAAFAECEKCIPNWPLLIYAHYAQNLDAADWAGIEYSRDDAMADPTRFMLDGADRDSAFGLGVEIGDKKRFARFGLGYYRLEADYFPALFMDSDISDGRTNRVGWTLYGSRQLNPNMDFGVTLFMSDEIETGPAFNGQHIFRNSLENSDRIRIQTDLNLKF